MTLISLLSALATVLGLSGAIPQILRMVRARSAAGQSPVGWLMGGLCHSCMVYVNAVGHHATLLAVPDRRRGVEPGSRDPPGVAPSGKAARPSRVRAPP